MKRLNSENFDSVVNEERGLFIIKFFSPTCGPCKTMSPVFEALASNNSNINLYEIDSMEEPEIAANFGVRGVPYVAYCEKREVLYHFTGLTSLADLQYVLDNIDDAHFRTYGDFKIEKKSGPRWFALSIIAIVIIFIMAFTLL